MIGFMMGYGGFESERPWWCGERTVDATEQDVSKLLRQKV